MEKITLELGELSRDEVFDIICNKFKYNENKFEYGERIEVEDVETLDTEFDIVGETIAEDYTTILTIVVPKKEVSKEEFALKHIGIHNLSFIMSCVDDEHMTEEIKTKAAKGAVL